eukprot:PITA_01925
MAKALCRKAALFTVLFCALARAALGDNLAVGYYKNICPAAEPIVLAVVKSAFHSSPEIAAKLIRLHFHDCFVRGCDGSVLIDSISGQFVAEKDSPANNPSLGGFNVIDNAKTLLEKICPKKVSCADIVAFAARDSAFLASPIRYPLWWDVPAGRKDGNISLASNIPGNLPPPTFNVTQLTQIFATKGLSQDEMVTLSGAHTIGVSHCTSFVSRVYNFNGTNTTDPSLDPSYAQKLKQKCPQGSPNNANTTVVMDPETPFILDNLYYNDVIAKRGLFTSDATLLTNPNTKSSVLGNSGSCNLVAWQKKFAAAMIKMGEISVLTGTQGGVHANCRVANS